MKIKKLLSLLEIFAVTSVVSVGFSTWTMVVTTAQTVEGNIQAEDVFDINECIEIKDMLFSDYNSAGFYQDFSPTAETTTTGILEFDVEVDLEKCSKLGSFNSLDFDLDLTCTTTFPTFSSLVSSITLTATYSIDGSDIANVGNITSTTAIPKQSDSFNIVCNNNQTLLVLNLKYAMEFGSNFSLFYTASSSSVFKGLNFDLLVMIGGIS